MLRFLSKTVTTLCTIAFLAAVGLAFTPVPQKIQHWLKTSIRSGVNPPKIMVVLGGGGLPSKSGLLRCYSAAEYYKQMPGMKVVVALPSDEDPETSSTGRMRDELVLRGVPAERIQMERTGRSTAEQAQAVAKLLGEDALFDSVLIVTDPTHMRRSLLSFKKVGFIDLVAGPSRSVSAEADPGPQALLRYGVWNNLQLEIECLREFTALQWYRYKQWN